MPLAMAVTSVDLYKKVFHRITEDPSTCSRGCAQKMSPTDPVVCGIDCGQAAGHLITHTSNCMITPGMDRA